MGHDGWGIVAALVTLSLEEAVLDPSYAFAVRLLEGPLALGGIDELLRANFELAGATYAAMWTAVAFPPGWLLGLRSRWRTWCGPRAETGSRPSGMLLLVVRRV